MAKINPALIYLTIAAVIWGATVPIMKITLVEIPIFSLIVLRMTVASLCLFPFIVKHLKIQKKDFKLLLLAALFGTNLNLAFFFLGLEYSQAINGSVILSTTPIFTLLFAHLYLKEKLSAKLIFGALLAFLGVVTFIGIPAFRTNWKAALGNLSLLASTLAWVAHEITAKKALKKYPPLLVAFSTMAIGATVFFPLMLLELINDPTWYHSLSTGGILGLLYGVFFSSLIAYTVWQVGLSKTTASQASFVFYLLPVTGVIFSIILLKESFSPFLILGSILVLVGIVLAEYHRKVHPLSKQLHD